MITQLSQEHRRSFWGGLGVSLHPSQTQKHLHCFPAKVSKNISHFGEESFLAKHKKKHKI